MSIHLNKPYKILKTRLKRYESHYQIPAARCLVVPLKQLGEEVSCDVRWEDDKGEFQLLSNKIFVASNLEPLNAILESKLYEQWQQCYPENVTT